MKRTVSLPLLSDDDRARRHGTQAVRNGRVRFVTDTDHLAFACRCGQLCVGPAAAGLEGIALLHDGREITLSLRISCPTCGFRDFVKLDLDVAGRYVPQIEGPARSWLRDGRKP